MDGITKFSMYVSVDKEKFTTYNRREKMSNHFRWATLGCLVLMCGVSAHAADKGLSVTGDFVGGYGLSWFPSGAVVNTAGGKQNESQFFVDNATVKMRFGVSDKVAVYFDNVASMNGAGPTNAAGTFGAGLNTVNYLSARGNLSGGAASRYALTNTGAYIEHSCTDNLKWGFGHQALPVGMEGMWDRYDMHSYYYTAARTAATALGMNYDVGLKLTLSDLIPGTLEWTLTDGRQVQTTTALATALRWSWTWKSGDMSLMPVVSGYFGRWRGGPKDWATTVGFNWKMSSIFANLEWFYTSTNPSFATNGETKNWSLWLEPGFDFGAAAVSFKVDMNNQKVGAAAGTTDFNVGAALSKTYADKYQVKLAYMHAGASGKLNNHGNDLRLLFGTKW
jgi:hypothetical protein